MEEIKLRPTVDVDRPDFVRLVSQTMEPIISKSVPNAAEEMAATYWETPKVSQTIVSADDDRFCGYCNLHFDEPGRPEIGIELVEKCRGRGLEPRALRTLIREQEGRHGVDWYRATVSGDNYASVSMMRRLGASPDGLCLVPWLDEELAASLEPLLMDIVDDRMRVAADWFGVASEKLLTHRLLFRVPARLD